MGVSFSLRHPAALCLAGVLTWTGCGGTKTAFDPVALSQNTDALAAAMDSSEAMQSMDVLGSKMTAAAPALGAASWAVAQLAAIERGAPTLSVAAPNAIVIPDSLLGKTFTYDPAVGHYVRSNLTGPTGVLRFILYQVHAVTADSLALMEPLTPIGCADVTDESTSSALKLHLKAYHTGDACNALNAPLIDYTASATITMSGSTVTSATVNATGFVSNGTTQVDFNLTRTYSPTSGVTLDYTLSAASADVEVRFQGSFTPSLQGSITLTVKNAGNTTVVSLLGTLLSVSGTITHNGVVVVNISGNQSNWNFTSATGDALTDTQVAALRRVSDFTNRLLTHVSRMLAPADALLHLSFALV